MEPLTLNVIIIIAAIASGWYQVRLFRLVRSPAFIYMAVAMAYLTIYRIILPVCPSIIDYGAILPFYILILLHTFHLYQMLARYLVKRK